MHYYFPCYCKECTKAVLYKSHLTKSRKYTELYGVWVPGNSNRLFLIVERWSSMWQIIQKKNYHNEVVGTVAHWKESMTVRWHSQLLRRSWYYSIICSWNWNRIILVLTKIFLVEMWFWTQILFIRNIRKIFMKKAKTSTLNLSECITRK